MEQAVTKHHGCSLCWRAIHRDEIARVVTHDKASLARSTRTGLQPLEPCDISSRVSPSFDSPPRAFGVHQDCYTLLKRDAAGESFIKDLVQLCASLTPDFHLSNRCKRQREKNMFETSFSSIQYLVHSTRHPIQNPSHPDLLKNLSRLPNELLLRISGYIWPDRFQSPITVLAESSRLLSYLRAPESNLHSRLHTFGWDDRVEISQLRVGGVTYISGLYSRPGRRDRLEKVVICYGELGVIDIQFLESSQEEARRHKNALWYQVYGKSSGKLQIRLKPLLVSGIAESTAQSTVFWDTPNPPIVRPHRVFCPQINSKDRLCLRYVDLTRKPAGIAIVYNYGGIIALAALHSVTPSHLEAHSLAHLDEHSTQVYSFLPFQKAECISRVWVRIGPNNSRAVLIVQMSSGNYHTLGPYVPRNYHHAYIFHELRNKTEIGVSGLCYNNLGEMSPERNVYFAAFCTTKTGEHPLEDPPWPPPFSSPPGAPGYEWFYSEAELNNLSSIRLCLDIRSNDRSILGVMLTYHDGAVKALGQWRIDMATEELAIFKEHRFMYWQGGSLSKVRQVFLAEDNTKTAEDWTSAPLNGTLSWWFSWSKASLEHFLVN